MMKLMPFDKTGPFYRGSLHSHTTASDGERTPERLLKMYAANGYDFVCITDHFLSEFHFPITVPEKPLSGLTVIPSAELHVGKTSNGWTWHMTANGLPVDFEPPKDGETTQEIARRAVEAGAFLSIVHPGWYQLTLEDAQSIDTAHAVEVFNAGCQVMHERGDGSYLVDGLLDKGRRIWVTAVDDSHGHMPDLALAWVNVKAASSQADDLLNALKNGQFYSSEGPEIHDLDWNPETKQLTIRTTAVTRILVNGQGYLNANACGEGITKATIDLSHFTHSPWMRIIICDRDGKKAWTNPYWFEDLC